MVSLPIVRVPGLIRSFGGVIVVVVGEVRGVVPPLVVVLTFVPLPAAPELLPVLGLFRVKKMKLPPEEMSDFLLASDALNTWRAQLRCFDVNGMAGIGRHWVQG